MSDNDTPCFYERDGSLALPRRVVVETVGTALLMLAVVASGLTCQRLGADGAIATLAGAVAVSASLVGLILAFGAVSGGHFNPMITIMQWMWGDRSPQCTISYVCGQIVGALIGSLLANSLFPAGITMPLVATNSMVWSEVVAGCGLMIVVFGCARSGRPESGPFGVGAWLTAAIIALPSGSVANPAIAIGCLIAVGPVALSKATAAMYVPAELLGGLVAFLLISLCYPRKDPQHPSSSKADASKSVRKAAAAVVSFRNPS
ncbi:aquaporin [Rhizobium sp. Root708]|uniref:aquaporin n=1 Tax=Rhizobium sp. Root708 TaxID=1736592 RepID=UPI0009E7D63C|nr:aquaporin [Rhizobium sp. Root708]